MGRLQLILFLFSILFFIIILYFIKRSKISLDLASVWILWGCGVPGPSSGTEGRTGCPRQ